MLQNSTVDAAGHLHFLHISYGAAAHGQLLQMQVDCKKAEPVVVGDRASYDLLLPRTPTRFTLEALSAKLTPGPSGRRLLVSAQRSCTPDDARLINFLAQFLQVDVLGACRFHLTYNTRHARELLRNQAGAATFSTITGPLLSVRFDDRRTVFYISSIYSTTSSHALILRRTTLCYHLAWKRSCRGPA